jgi:hypothetical protein
LKYVNKKKKKAWGLRWGEERWDREGESEWKVERRCG